MRNMGFQEVVWPLGSLSLIFLIWEAEVVICATQRAVVGCREV